jgi:5-methylcytosine-specific restriction protein A
VQRGRCTAHTRNNRNTNAYAKVVHAWYCSKRWQDIRADVIRAEPFCKLCIARGLRVLTVDVDHIRPHKGDPYLFWNLENLQGLCKACHSRKTTAGY